MAEVARAYQAAREIFAAPEIWLQIEALDERVAMETKSWLVAELRRLVRRGTRWLLRNRRCDLDALAEIEHFAPRVKELVRLLPQSLKGEPLGEWRGRQHRILQAGGSEALADVMASAQSLHVCLALVEAAESAKASLKQMAEVYFELGEALELQWLAERMSELEVENHWQAQARESARDDLEWQQRALSVSVLRIAEPGDDSQRAVGRWLMRYDDFARRWNAMLAELHAATSPDFAMCAVALRELLDWAQSCSARPGSTR